MRKVSVQVSLTSFALLLVFHVAQARAADHLLRGMVHFDQAYIPALAYTSDEKLQPARAAMKTLTNEWQTFREKYRTDTRSDKQWSSDFDKVDGYIRAAEKIVASGKNLKDAHEELEHIRIVFMHLRERNGLEYYIDHLTRFHEPMEQIVLAAKGKTEKTLSEENIRQIRETLPIALRFWRATTHAKFDASLYAFSKKQQAELQDLVVKEQRALDRLEKVLTKGNKSQIIDAAVGIKPGFAKIFKSFGHFQKISVPRNT